VATPDATGAAPELRKYPRTHHLEGSRRQPGDEDLDSVPFRALIGRHLVVEEKVDGANAGLSFGVGGRLLLQSRGHFLTGGPRERHFALFKAWAARHREHLLAALGTRHVLYGEWLYAKHTVFYDALPHYFLEFDVLDTADGSFLSTDRRRALLAGLPLVSVPVLWEGSGSTLAHLRTLLGPSRYKTPQWKERLPRLCAEMQLDAAGVARETDPSDLMEGLYVQVDEAGRVSARYKLIRADYLTAVLESGSHWLDRPTVTNQLRSGIDLFAESTGTDS
jgi:RNA ligase